MADSAASKLNSRLWVKRLIFDLATAVTDKPFPFSLPSQIHAGIQFGNQ